MTYKELALNRYIIEQVKEGKKPSVSHDDKVDLDDIADYWDNIIMMIEKEVKKKPNTKLVAFRLVIEV